MKPLKRIRYYTMNSWNQATAPAYNLKIYNVINKKLQDKVFGLMECEELWEEIRWRISDFNENNDYDYQAGFNGRSGGYLVLYEGGKRLSGHKSYCINCGQRNYETTQESGHNICGKCGEKKRVNHISYTVYTSPGISIDERTVPTNVLKSFRRLALDIVKLTERMARDYNVVEETVMVPKRVKSLKPVKEEKNNENDGES